MHWRSNFRFSFFHKHVFFFYLSLFLKRKVHIKVIEVIPLIVFSFVYPGVSPLLFIYFILFHSFYHLFYFISIIINFKLFFPTLCSLFLTFQEVDMTALQFAGPSFPLSSSYHPSYYFYLLTPHPLILILTLFWGWHSCLTVCQSLNTYSFYFSTYIFYLILYRLSSALNKTN